MNKILVLYKSKYGATRKYADLLKEELACDILEVRKFSRSVLEPYDAIVFAGGVYASGISGIRVLQKNYPMCKDKKVAVFCVGASPFDEKAIREIRKHNLKGDIKDIPLFYGRGAWDESRMTLKDRTLCKMLQKMVAKQDPASSEPWVAALLSAVGKKCDWTDKTYLVPLIQYITD